MTEQLTEKGHERRRPFGLWMIIILQLLIALVVVLSLSGLERADPYLRSLVQNPLYYSGLGWVLVVLLALAIIGMLRLKRWGWVLTMVLTGVGLLFSIWSYFQGSFDYIAMLAYIVIVFYLNQHDVQSPFERWSYPGGAR